MTEAAVKQEEPQAVNSKITCQVWGEQVHVIASHIKKTHSDRVESATDAVISTLGLSEEEAKEGTCESSTSPSASRAE